MYFSGRGLGVNQAAEERPVLNASLVRRPKPCYDRYMLSYDYKLI